MPHRSSIDHRAKPRTQDKYWNLKIKASQPLHLCLQDTV